MQQLQKVSILLYSYPNEDFWKRNSFLKLCLNAFEKKKEPVSGELSSIQQFSKMEKIEK